MFTQSTSVEGTTDDFSSDFTHDENSESSRGWRILFYGWVYIYTCVFTCVCAWSFLCSCRYTAFKSKWQIVNLCSSQTTSLKAFKFSVNVSNNWPFCHAKTQILILNSLGVIKALKSYQFCRKNQFVPAIHGRTFFFYCFFPD